MKFEVDLLVNGSLAVLMEVLPDLPHLLKGHLKIKYKFHLALRDDASSSDLLLLQLLFPCLSGVVLHNTHLLRTQVAKLCSWLYSFFGGNCINLL